MYDSDVKMEKIEKNSLAIFENFKIRRHYDEKKEKWYFSVVDIVAVLIEETNYQKARKYWNKLSERLKKEGSQTVTNCHRLKMIAQDGKMRETDIADVETIFRLVQSVPSKKAEPIKMWLAKVGNERIQEMTDPEKALNRSRKYWENQGRSKKWIQQRMMGQEVRNKLTDYWSENEIKEGREFAILTNIIHQEWAEISIRDHKKIKGLKNQNLRDHMNDAELIFTALAELSTRQIAENIEAVGMDENKTACQKGGKIAKNARKELESKTNKKVVSGENFLKDINYNKLK